MRRVANERFSKESVKTFCETQLTEAVVLAYNWLVDSKQWDRHLRHCTESTMLSVLYGRTASTQESDRAIETFRDFSARIARAAYPGTYLVEFFPWMRHIPSR